MNESKKLETVTHESLDLRNNVTKFKFQPFNVETTIPQRIYEENEAPPCPVDKHMKELVQTNK